MPLIRSIAEWVEEETQGRTILSRFVWKTTVELDVDTLPVVPAAVSAIVAAVDDANTTLQCG